MTSDYIDSKLSNEDYHKHSAVSRSRLWKLYNKTPKHSQVADDYTSSAMDFGSGLHVAILEPNLFDAKVIKGTADRRGNKWKDIIEANPDALVLVEADYDAVLLARNSAFSNPLVKKFVDSGLQNEHSAFALDKETGLQLRVRPDAYSASLAMMGDLKTSRFIHKSQWEKQAADLGYHLQEPMYSEVWKNAGGGDVDAFIFIVVENEAPYCTQVFEFDPESIEEGKAIMRKALSTWRNCVDENYWPGTPSEVQQTSIPRWAFKETTPFI